MSTRSRLQLNQLSHGEVLCPRKATPFPALIAVAVCKASHDAQSEACAAHACLNFLDAEVVVAAFPDDVGNYVERQRRPAPRSPVKLPRFRLAGSESPNEPSEPSA